MGNIDTIINEIKKGRTYTVACSQYEEYFWYSDGQFYGAMENGVNDPKSKVIDEDVVRREISIAIYCPDEYDGFFDFE